MSKYTREKEKKMTRNAIIKMIREQKRLIEKRQYLWQVIHFANSVSNKKIEQVVSQVNPENAQEIIDAYKSDDIGKAFFDFVAYCKIEKENITEVLRNMPQIPMEVFLTVK